MFTKSLCTSTEILEIRSSRAILSAFWYVIASPLPQMKFPDWSISCISWEKTPVEQYKKRSSSVKNTFMDLLLSYN